jgi:REP element-mobilizing transposase RayT
MPRQARLDAPGALHHVMARGIEGTNIFRTDRDRDDFLDCLAAQCETDALKIYAWALIPNHFHLLVRTSTDQGILSIGSEEVWAHGGECCLILGSHDLLGKSVCCFQFQWFS